MGSTGARRAAVRTAAAVSECAALACAAAAVCAAAALDIVSAAAYVRALERQQAPACVVEFRYAGLIDVYWACARLVVDEGCHSYADLPAFLAVHAAQEYELERVLLR